jgi:hypothetical protein
LHVINLFITRRCMTIFYYVSYLTVQLSHCLCSLSLLSQVGLIVLSAPVITKSCMCQLHDVFTDKSGEIMLIIFNVAPCILPHFLYNPTHALFTLKNTLTSTFKNNKILKTCL